MHRTINFSNLKTCIPTDKQAALTENSSTNSLKRFLVAFDIFCRLDLYLNKKAFSQKFAKFYQPKYSRQADKKTALCQTNLQ
jgi:hypothetical protein